MRIRKKNLKSSPVDKLIDKRNTLAKQSGYNNSEELMHLYVTIAQIIAEENRAKCHKMKKFCDQNGSINTLEIWKLKKKLWPNKPSLLPSAKVNHKGKLVSSAEDIKGVMVKEYRERLRHRPRHPKDKCIQTRSSFGKQESSHKHG